jgi:hypothetical protein
MRAVLCNGFHGIKALSIGEAAEPRPGADFDRRTCGLRQLRRLLDDLRWLSEAASSPLRTGNGRRRGCRRLRRKRSAVSSR